MASETFKERFQQGDLGDDEDYFEWVAALKALKHWEEKLSDLRAAG